MTSAEAAVRVTQFIENSRHARHRCVSVIHGKGLNSAGGVATLRTRVREVLMRTTAVLAFAPAPASGGGSGAVYICSVDDLGRRPAEVRRRRSSMVCGRHIGICNAGPPQTRLSSQSNRGMSTVESAFMDILERLALGVVAVGVPPPCSAAGVPVTTRRARTKVRTRRH
jgi:hypothetical protein